MLGVIIGDIVGSRFEWHNIKSKEFELFTDRCHFTDDSVMSLAIADAIINCKGDYSNLSKKTVLSMQMLGRRYPDAGYGKSFRSWLAEENPQPYRSWGNGSAMRVGPCGFVANTIEEAIELSQKTAVVTHNHPEAIKGAEAVAVSIYLAKTGTGMSEIKEYINKHYYNIDFCLDDIRESYKFDVSCQGSVPQALEAFFESKGFEDAIRNAVSIGGDSDTIAAMAGGVAAAYYGIHHSIREEALSFLTDDLLEILLEFERLFPIE